MRIGMVKEWCVALCGILHRFTADCATRHEVPARKRHYKADIATLADVWTVYFAPTPLGYLGALEVL